MGTLSKTTQCNDTRQNDAQQKVTQHNDAQQYGTQYDTDQKTLSIMALSLTPFNIRT
jgi:hypothetical protein